MDSKLVATFAAPIITGLLGFFLNKYFQNVSRLIAYYGHISSFKVKQNDDTFFDIHTHSVVITNIGKLTAKNVTLGHNTLPPNINITPAIQYQIQETPGGSQEITIPTMVPNQQITISYLYMPPTTYGNINTYIKSDEGFAKIINVIPSPAPSFFKRAILSVMLFFGTSTIIYFIIMLLIFLSGKNFC